ncbi:hypothetical protein HK13_07270 [Acetobacter indonesiensis]|uniref:hypothetical protein n=1 Tax=Acetobacter indonesiensis TaxID=104101 RepID=UPI000A38A5CC|nr:hypothetical protein [Acetobacter indonesiensis]OUI93685.1 hypothetical protein HK13_07270 [Acetobacter indonesiensis]
MVLWPPDSATIYLEASTSDNDPITAMPTVLNEAGCRSAPVLFLGMIILLQAKMIPVFPSS